jgi:phospholipase C
MPYTVNHTYVAQVLSPSVSIHHGLATVQCTAFGSLAIRFPGKLRISARAEYQEGVEADEGVGDSGGGVHGHIGAQVRSLPLTIEIKTPDGQLFTADHITLNDLRRFRDLRGSSQGSWSYRVHGQSQPIAVGQRVGEVEALQGYLTIIVEETVTSQSAPPLVNDRLGAQDQRRYAFDLYRVGTFVATAKPDSFLGLFMGDRTLRLFDPDGAEVARGDDGHVTFPVPLETLEKSRDAHGNARLWSLEVSPSLSSTFAGEATVWATVVATARIHTETLKSRLDDLIGVGGSKISIYGDMQPVEQKLLARLKILDEYSAETIDLLGLLDPVLKRFEQDPGVDINEIKANVPYIVASRSRDLPHEMHVSLDGVKVDTINVAIGASQAIQPPIPALKLELAVEGVAIIKLGGFPIATVRVNNNQIALEAGVRRNADGTFSAETWINDDPLIIDVSWEAAVAAGVVSVGLLVWGEEGLAKYFQSEYNDKVIQGIHNFLASVMGQVPAVLAMIMGGDFTYQSIGVVGDDIVFDYIAPLEPDPKPSPNYLGIIGRSAIQLGPEAWQITPRRLGDTWAAQNLLTKIDHIVMVMMENRSFNHVLGYRAQLAAAQNEDGLTAELLAFLDSQNYPIPRLNQSGIVPNPLGFRTRFPISVGHHVSDVAQQLSERLTDPSGRTIVSPKGFVDNFTPRASAPITPEDVLGYYVGDDLPLTRFLADNYAYCERFFCSHPGPTLPNRMYWLSGDIQYDRTGEAILDNSNGDSFALSRAMTIFDLLTRKGIGWRVYESFPSVTMLRMFARYATDDTNIVPISRLQQDVAQGNLSPVTAIEPAMHSAPENDDHPTADMYYGQLFLKGVYDTLRSNSALWEKTLLIITYDEHGGFYDHVVPPIADVQTRPMVMTQGGPRWPAPFTSPTLVINYGLRVPTFVVSPWVPAGKGPDIVLDHCSISKTILARFCGETKPFVSDRVNASRTFEAYLSELSPRMNVPASPSLSALPFRAPPKKRRAIETAPISRRILNEGVDFHELSGMVARMLGR